MTDAYLLYLDTAVLRALWKLHLKDWEKNDHRLDNAKKLRDLLGEGRSKNTFRAITSVFTIMEMIQFDQSKHYARLRLKSGDDPKDVLDNWNHLPQRWEDGRDFLQDVLAGADADLQAWSQSDDYALIEVRHAPGGRPESYDELPKLLAFALRLSLVTPVDQDDCFHAAYMFRYADGILSTDGGLLKALRTIARTASVLDAVKAGYLSIFGEPLPEDPFRFYVYPGDLPKLPRWRK